MDLDMQWLPQRGVTEAREIFHPHSLADMQPLRLRRQSQVGLRVPSKLVPAGQHLNEGVSSYQRAPTNRTHSTSAALLTSLFPLPGKSAPRVFRLHLNREPLRGELGSARTRERTMTSLSRTPRQGARGARCKGLVYRAERAL
jgi:hypothetical protein